MLKRVVLFAWSNIEDIVLHVDGVLEREDARRVGCYGIRENASRRFISGCVKPHLVERRNDVKKG